MTLHPAYTCPRCRRTVYWAEGHACLRTFKREPSERERALSRWILEPRPIPAPLVDRDPGDESEAA